MDRIDRILFVTGPPRSGTTIAARALNTHPVIFNHIDDHVHECWDLYYYRTRRGLVQDIRDGRIEADTARKRLMEHIIHDRHLVGVAPSSKTESFPDAPPPQRPGQEMIEADRKLRRQNIPLHDCPDDWRLCLKSPEISFVLPEMAALFPKASFVLVTRPVLEIAESMYRKGRTVKKVAVYQRRWHQEKHPDGTLQAPPGVPANWEVLWNGASDFKRCAIYAASYMKSLLDGLKTLNPGRYFVYNHTEFRSQPQTILREIAEFLQLPTTGFNTINALIDAQAPHIPEALSEEMSELEETLGIKQLEASLDEYCAGRRQA